MHIFFSFLKRKIAADIYSCCHGQRTLQDITLGSYSNITLQNYTSFSGTAFGVNRYLKSQPQDSDRPCSVESGASLQDSVRWSFKSSTDVIINIKPEYDGTPNPALVASGYNWTC